MESKDSLSDECIALFFRFFFVGFFIGIPKKKNYRKINIIGFWVEMQLKYTQKIREKNKIRKRSFGGIKNCCSNVKLEKPTDVCLSGKNSMEKLWIYVRVEKQHDSRECLVAVDVIASRIYIFAATFAYSCLYS